MIKNFEEIVTLQRGFDLPEHSRTKGEFPLYAASGLSDRIDTFKAFGPGVITGRSGTIGQVYYTDENYWPLNTTLFVKDFHGNNPKYISYWLSQFDLQKYSNGASVPTLNRNELNGLKCAVHDTTEQKHIVNTIGSVDDLIENYNKQILSLISQGDLLLLEANKLEPLSRYANILLGGTPSRSHPEYWNGDVSWINSGAITGSPAILNCSEKITDLGVKKSATKCANTGETVLSIIEPSKEKVSLILDDKTYFNQSVICISAKDHRWQGLMFFASRKLIDKMKGYATGAAQQSINKDLVEKEQIVIPNDSTIQKLEIIKNRIVDLENKIRVLTVQKNLLLSKYF